MFLSSAHYFKDTHTPLCSDPCEGFHRLHTSTPAIPTLPQITLTTTSTLEPSLCPKTALQRWKNQPKCPHVPKMVLAESTLDHLPPQNSITGITSVSLGSSPSHSSFVLLPYCLREGQCRPRCVSTRAHKSVFITLFVRTVSQTCTAPHPNSNNNLDRV